jgi:hypothetical protein
VADLVLRLFAKKMGELEQDKISFSPFFYSHNRIQVALSTIHLALSSS